MILRIVRPMQWILWYGVHDYIYIYLWLLYVLYIYRYICNFIYTQNEDKLLRIWNGEPCHTAKAKIGKITIHHGSFHSLKDNGFLNDEASDSVYIIDHDVHVVMYSHVLILCRLSMATWDCWRRCMAIAMLYCPRQWLQSSTGLP